MTDDLDPKAGDNSLLPYDSWTQDALRGVVSRALTFAGKHGLPGEHFFYVTFLTNYPGVTIPTRLLTQYKREMTIVLQHQFWDLVVDEAAQQFSVGLSFGGIPATLVVPLAAIVGFSDPHVQLTLQFSPPDPAVADKAGQDGSAASPSPAPQSGVPAATPESTTTADSENSPQVVQLDAFRRRPPASEQSS